MQPISSSSPAKPNSKTQTQPQNQILMPKKSILMPQNSFLDSKLKPKGEKLTFLKFYHPKGRKKVAPAPEKRLRRWPKAVTRQTHSRLTFFLTSVSRLRQKEIRKREENELGRRRRRRPWEKEKEKKEMG